MPSVLASRTSAVVVGRTAFAALMAVGLFAQMGALWLRGTGDVLLFKQWGVVALQKGLPAAYSLEHVRQGRLEAPPDYPPVSVGVLAGMARVARAFDASIPAESRGLTVLVKLPVLMLRVGVAIALFVTTRRFTGRDDLARRLTLAYWLNPALILAGPVLGYLDTWCWIPAALALIAASRQRPGTAGALLALSILIKPQGLLFVLPVASAILRGGRTPIMRAAIVAGTVVAVVVLPFALTTPRGFLIGLKTNFTEDLLSGDAMNFWWMVGVGGQLWDAGWAAPKQTLESLALSSTAQRFGFDPRPWAALAIVAVAIWAFSRVQGRAGLGPHAAMGALLIHVYFTVGISVHENHLVYGLPLAAMATVAIPAYRHLAWGFTAMITINLFLFYGFGRDAVVFQRTGWFWAISTAGAAGGLLLLAWHGYLFWTRTARPPEPSRLATDHLPVTASGW